MHEFTKALEKHTKEDHVFQDETRLFNSEMAIFKAETEGSLAILHQKLDKMLIKVEGLDNKFNPKHPDYFFMKMDVMYDIYEGLGFSKKMLILTASIVGSFAIIVGGLFSAIRFIK